MSYAIVLVLLLCYGFCHAQMFTNGQCTLICSAGCHQECPCKCTTPPPTTKPHTCTPHPTTCPPHPTCPHPITCPPPTTCPPCSTTPIQTTTPSITTPPPSTSPQCRNCTFSQGYWKTHNESWPPGTLGETLCGVLWLDWIQMNPSGGDAQIILVLQYIAAQLNMISCNETNITVIAEVSLAKSILEAHCSTNYTNLEKQIAVQLAAELEQYNLSSENCTATPVPLRLEYKRTNSQAWIVFSGIIMALLVSAMVVLYFGKT